MKQNVMLSQWVKNALSQRHYYKQYLFRVNETFSEAVSQILTENHEKVHISVIEAICVFLNIWTLKEFNKDSTDRGDSRIKLVYYNHNRSKLIYIQHEAIMIVIVTFAL
jgi:hypothetical protein